MIRPSYVYSEAKMVPWTTLEAANNSDEMIESLEASVFDSLAQSIHESKGLERIDNPHLGAVEFRATFYVFTSKELEDYVQERIRRATPS